MHDYKIGDHVIVEEGNIEDIYKCAGKTGVIVNITHYANDHPYCVKMDDDKYVRIWCSVKGYVTETSVKRVIFNDPATVIFWDDGTKTVAKVVKGDKYDPEKGFAIAYAKKFGGKTFREEMEKWCESFYCDENKPLTLEQLKKMDGKRVWASSIYMGKENFTDKYCGWCTVDVGAKKVKFSDASFYEFYFLGSDCGFNAYLTPQTGKK